MTEIYPKELVLVPEEGDGKSTHFLDLNIVIKDGFISTSIYDKRDSFDFPIVNFPFLNSNISKKLEMVFLLVNESDMLEPVHIYKISLLAHSLL